MAHGSKVYRSIIPIVTGVLMVKVVIIYDSKTGNTEKAAKAVLEGVRSCDVDVVMQKVDGVDPQVVSEADATVIGSYCFMSRCSPGISAFIKTASAHNALSGKSCAVFGTYKRTGGQVEKLEAEMTKLGMKVITPGVNVRSSPDEEGTRRLKELGRLVGAAVKAQ
jgi:flavodoxin I